MNLLSSLFRLIHIGSLYDKVFYYSLMSVHTITLTEGIAVFNTWKGLQETSVVYSGLYNSFRVYLMTIASVS